MLPGDASRADTRNRYGIQPDALLFGCFGGLTKDKRLPQIIRAFAELLVLEPAARLMLGGAVASYYDVNADLERAGVAGSTIVTGYLNSEDELTAHIAACDATINLRWPTAREISGPWLRALALGRPTIVTQLSHMADVPSLDPRTWRVSTAVPGDWADDAGTRAVRGSRRSSARKKCRSNLWSRLASPKPSRRRACR